MFSSFNLSYDWNSADAVQFFAWTCVGSELNLDHDKRSKTENPFHEKFNLSKKMFFFQVVDF